MSPWNEKKSVGAAPLLLPQPVVIVGTYDSDNKPNGMTLSWGGICGGEPPCLALAVRPSRWTHDALLNRKAFTVGIPASQMAAPVDYLGLVSGRQPDKIDLSGFTPVRSAAVDAPYFAECPLIMECRLKATVNMTSHTLVIGAIIDVKVDQDCLDDSGEHPDITKISPLVYDGSMNRYFGLGDVVGQAFSMGKSIKAK